MKKTISIESQPSWDLLLLTVMLDSPKVDARRSRDQYEKDIEQDIKKALALYSKSRGFTQCTNQDFILLKMKTVLMAIYDIGISFQRLQRTPKN